MSQYAIAIPKVKKFLEGAVEIHCTPDYKLFMTTYLLRKQKRCWGRPMSWHINSSISTTPPIETLNKDNYDIEKFRSYHKRHLEIHQSRNFKCPSNSLSESGHFVIIEIIPFLVFLSFVAPKCLLANCRSYQSKYKWIILALFGSIYLLKQFPGSLGIITS